MTSNASRVRKYFCKAAHVWYTAVWYQYAWADVSINFSMLYARPVSTPNPIPYPNPITASPTPSTTDIIMGYLLHVPSEMIKLIV